MEKERREKLVLSLLERVAQAHERCPTNPEIAEFLQQKGMRAKTGSIAAVLGTLALGGYIVIYIYPKNWRQVEIVSGLHAGKSTLQPPNGTRPYRKIDAAERANFGNQGPGGFANGRGGRFDRR